MITRFRISKQTWRSNRAGYLFLLPWLVGFFGLTLIPMLSSLYLSFTSYDLLTPSRWIGLDNYKAMFTSDRAFADSVKTTLLFVFLSVPCKLAFALLIAIVLNRQMAAVKLYRTAFYIPSLLGGSVAISIVWKKVFDGDGLVNQALALFHLDGPSWISHPHYAGLTLVALTTWQFGSSMVIFLAGLKQIPTELYEASGVDGARKMRQFFHITLPLLTPVIFFNLVMQFIHAFQTFTSAFIISGGTGGPTNSTLLYTLYLYMRAFNFFEFGYASAMAWLLLVVLAAFTAFLFISSRFWVFYEDGRK
ncbi:carbohydrate ABC transporter permease [Paenibacillus hodogayensis]|uniref:Carbohydrate ABC transporter permease n=1 Tax=Paenibacillus hodogayensis TaxID=279208 RepID=A0ABV5VZQ8_9BACL